MKKSSIALLAGGLFLAAGVAQAKEGGDQYPNGIETWYAGALPPPGTYFLNYLGYYGGTLKDGEGDKVKLNAKGDTARVDATFDALRLVHITDVKILGHGELTKTLTVSAHRFSATAREKIEAAGGTVSPLRAERVEGPSRKRRKIAAKKRAAGVVPAGDEAEAPEPAEEPAAEE